MRYIIGMLILGLLLFIAAPFCGDVALRGIVFKVEDLLINISATFFSLALLTGAYQLFGEEQTILLLKQIAKAQSISQKILDIGIKSLEKSRGDFDTKVIENTLLKSKEIFVVSNNFGALKYVRLQNYLIEYMKNGGHLKLLVSADSAAMSQITEFRDKLPKAIKNKLSCKKVDAKYIKCGMYGGDSDIYATLYLHHLSGDESPAFHCQKKENGYSLYDVYHQEFILLWNKGVEI
jgi:hypothetical protein